MLGQAIEEAYAVDISIRFRFTIAEQNVVLTTAEKLAISLDTYQQR